VKNKWSASLQISEPKNAENVSDKTHRLKTLSKQPGCAKSIGQKRKYSLMIKVICRREYAHSSLGASMADFRCCVKELLIFPNMDGRKKMLSILDRVSG
jgi:hypothetical protein